MKEQEKQKLIGQVLEAWDRQEKAGKIRRFQELNKIAQKGQIVFAGSSLMEQFPIYEMLLNRKLPYIIYNRGVGGFTTQELLDNLEACILDLEPGTVFLNIGTNDMNGNDYVLSEFLERYERIVVEIRKNLPEVKLFLLAFYPVNQDAAPDQNIREAFRYRTNERIQEANRAIRIMAEQYHAEYLDLNAGLTDEKGRLKRELTVDGVHMHVEGYQIVMENLMQHVCNAFCDADDRERKSGKHLEKSRG